MIVHNVVVGKKSAAQNKDREHKRIYVGCAEADIRYRDMLVNFRHRWELYSRPTIEFVTFDRNEAEIAECKAPVEEAMNGVDGVIVIVSSQTSADPLALWVIDSAVANDIPIVGIDIGKHSDDDIPSKLVGKITKYGWEWFAEFFNNL